MNRSKAHFGRAGQGRSLVRASVCLGLLMLGVFPPLGRAASIDNTAFISYTKSGTPGSIASSTASAPVKDRTPAEITFKAFANGTSGGTDYAIVQTIYNLSGGGQGTIADPELFGTPIDISVDVPLKDAALYRSGSPVFILLTDLDQNLDPAVRETVELDLTADATGDSETIVLTEVLPNSGIFAAYIPTSTAAAAPLDGSLSVADESSITASYTDAYDATDAVAAAAAVNPFGFVFDTVTGAPVAGATIRLIDTATGTNAVVYDADGTTIIPAVLVSDAAGAYQFPVVPPGDYQMEIIPPLGYAATTLTIPDVQALPGAPYELTAGSFGSAFTVGAVSTFLLDLPLDPITDSAFIVKTAGRKFIGIGEFLRYEITVKNPNAVDMLDAELIDLLPCGFRYEEGSSYLGGTRVADPSISGGGRELRYDLGTLPAGEERTIRYVIRTGAGSIEGEAVNTAVLFSSTSSISFAARARVYVRDDMRPDATIIGRVAINPHAEDVEHFETPSSSQTNAWEGVPGVRLYMEDGAYVITDKEGLYHFEGVKPGTHVVQLDVTTLPAGLEPVAIENTRFAKRAYSQFVEVQAGTLWRADFPVRRLAPAVSAIDLKMMTTPFGADGLVEIGLTGRQAPVGQLKVIVVAPKDTIVDPATLRLNDAPVEAEQLDNMLTFRLSENGTNWAYRFEMKVSPEDFARTNDYKVMVMYDWGSQRNQRLPLHIHTAAIRDSIGTESSHTLPKPDRSAPKVAVLDASGNGSARFTTPWLETLEPGFDWVTPSPDARPTMPAINVALKHGAKESVKLYVNGRQAYPLNYEGKIRNSIRTVAVSRWRGLTLVEGWNELESVLHAENGEVITRISRRVYFAGAPVKAEYLEAGSTLVADGRTVPTVKVRFTDANGEPARLGLLGEYSVNSPYEPYVVNEGLTLAVTDPGVDRQKFEIGANGVAELRIAPTSVSGEAVFNLPLFGKQEQLKVWLEAPLREWILVGFAEGTIGYNDLSSNMEACPDDVEEDCYDDGKVAFFAKGRIRGDYLMTIAYDSSKDVMRNGRNSLFQTIDPDTYYTLYGDETRQGYDAASSEKLYLKIEKKTFYALFGDYETDLTVTELGRYSRSMTGFKSAAKSEHFEYSAFATETGQGFIKDELRGNGTSGLYQLSSGRIVYNSEKIVIETRSRFHNEQVVSRRPLTRHIDYNIDYQTGTLFFKEAIPSRDRNLDLNYIVADYEVDNGGKESWTYGGRIAGKVAGVLELGVTAISEGQPDDDDELFAADVKLELGANTTLKAEIAESDATDPVDGKKKGTAALIEVEHESEQVAGRIYYREQSEYFGLSQQSSGESGTEKYGAQGSAKLSPSITANAELYRQDNQVTDTTRDVAEADVKYKKDRFGVRTGYLYAEDRFSNGDKRLSEQVLAGANYEVWKDRINTRLDHYQSLGGRNANADFPTRTVLGADYALTDSVQFFTEYEIADGKAANTQNLRVGLETEPWTGGKINTSLGQDLNESGPRTFSNLGLYQTLKLTEKWSIDGGVDMAQTLNGGPRETVNEQLPPASGDVRDFWALSLGTGYKEQKWSWSQRAEQLWSDDGDRFSYVQGVIGQVKPRLSMSLSTALFDQNGETEDQFSVDVRHGLAYRPLESDWILLNRLDLIYDERIRSNDEEYSQRIVNQLNANYHPSRKLQMSFRYGCKFVVDEIGGDQYDAFTDLYGWEMRYDINRKWDVGCRLLALHSWTGHEVDYSTGPSIGYNLATNIWLSLGYNVTGFYDEDFSGANYTAQGPYLRFRIKFDQDTLDDLNAMLKSVVHK